MTPPLDASPLEQVPNFSAMNDEQLTDYICEHSAKADALVQAMNSGTAKWRMRVPVDPDDSDMIVGLLAEASREAARRLRADRPKMGKRTKRPDFYATED